jgi:hypothetical protein
MTMPDRDPRNPLDINTKARPYRQGPTTGPDWGAGFMIGLFALFVAFSLVFYFNKDHSSTAAVDDRPAATAPSTTGTRSSEMPLPTPPTVPSSPQQQ